jgi:hypothetical protein
VPTSDPQINQWPRLTRFYGIGPAELAVLERWAINLYLEMLPPLQAEEQMLAMQVADFPQTEDRERKKAWRRLQRMVEDTSDTPAAPAAPTVDVASQKDVADLSAIGIKIVLEPPEGSPPAEPATLEPLPRPAPPPQPGDE